MASLAETKKTRINAGLFQYLIGIFNESEIERWANAIESREDIEYDPQYDDLDFNNTVLYPYDHSWFERMVQNHIDNHSVGSVVRAINNNSNTDYWDTASKEEAIQYINNKRNQ